MMLNKSQYRGAAVGMSSRCKVQQEAKLSLG